MYKQILFIQFITFLLLSFYSPKLSFAGLPIRSILIIVIFLQIIPFVLKVQSNKIITKISVIFILFFVISIVTEIYYAGSINIKDSFRFVIQTYIVLIVYLYFFFDEKYKLKVINSFILISFISSLVALLQYVGIDFFYQLRYIIGGFPENQKILYLNTYRPPGLSLFALHLAYQNLIGIFLTVYMYNLKINKIYLYIGFFLLFIIIITGTRSPIIGLLFSLVLIIILNFHKVKITPVGLLYTFIVIFFIFTLIFYIDSDELRVTRFDNKSATDKLPLLLYGLQLFLDNPLGYGLSFDTTSIASNYFVFINTLGLNFYAIENLALHNSYINILVCYGIFGFILYLYFLYTIFNLRLHPSLKYFKILFLAYFVNILVHNAGIFYGDLFCLIIFSLLISENINYKKKENIYEK